MRRIAILLAAIVVGVLVATGVGIAASSSGSQQQTSSSEEDPSVSVMTRNVYHGVNAEFAQAAAAQSFPEFLAAARAVYEGYHERNFPERAAGLAAEIEETQPDVVGLQEVVMVRTTPTAPLGDLDYLQILLDALEARGLKYTPVVQSINWDVEVPTSQGFDLRHTDRIVTLIRTGGKSGLKVLGTNSDHFQTNCPLSAAGQTFVILRGWTSVDLSIRGKPVRLINTHLDGDCSDVAPAIQHAQAQEIIQGPVQDAKDKNLPVILLGDLNSKADGTGTATYANLLKPEVGFADAWAEEGRDPVTHPELGYTCCQDADLLNPDPSLEDRRDFVLYLSGSLQATDAEVVGANPADRTPSGLWPSDHAGVVSDLRLLSE